MLEQPSGDSSCASEIFAQETLSVGNYELVAEVSDTEDSIIFCTTSPTTTKQNKFVDDDSLFSSHSSVKIDSTPKHDNSEAFMETLKKLMKQSREEKYDDMDRFFLLLSSLVKKYNLSLTEQMNIQCSIMTFVKDELEKIKSYSN